MRPSLRQFINERGQDFVTAMEVGVADGNNAEIILDNLKIDRLYLVDSWSLSYNKQALDWMMKTAKKFESDPRVIMVRGKSADVLRILPERAIDYIYIDACHAYSVAKDDILASLNLVRTGGMISGHDYDEEKNRVYRAVKEISTELGLEYHHEDLDWWIWIREGALK